MIRDGLKNRREEERYGKRELGWRGKLQRKRYIKEMRKSLREKGGLGTGWR